MTKATHLKAAKQTLEEAQEAFRKAQGREQEAVWALDLARQTREERHHEVVAAKDILARIESMPDEEE